MNTLLFFFLLKLGIQGSLELYTLTMSQFSHIYDYAEHKQLTFVLWLI